MQPIRDPAQGAQTLESILLTQLIQESGAFKGTSQAGGKLYGEMFCEALANAVAQNGGVGIAKLVEGCFSKSGEVTAEGPESDDVAGQLLLQRGARSGSTGTSSATSSATSDAPSDATESGSPVTPEVSSGYGKRKDPIDGSSRFHTGVDVAAPEGSPVLAAAAGVVRRAGRRGGYGNAVEVDHGGGLSTLYGHASKLAVKEGEHIVAGQAIAAVGHTGRATGSHLHFEVRQDGKPTDPQSALNGWGERADILVGRKP
jgi:murein DD-endopeptidase MepM/ murein hydrolase activator NlpD